jgi:hypothetical protein
MQRKSSIYVALAAALFSASWSTACRADGDNPGGTSVRFGIANPTDSFTKSALGSTWYQLGFDMSSKPKSGGPSGTSATVMFEYLDMTWGKASASASGSDGNGGTVNISVSQSLFSLGTGIGVKEIFNRAQTTQPYVGAAVGVYDNIFSQSISGSDGSNSVSLPGSTNSFNVGGKLVAGVSFQNKYELEAAYNLQGSVAGAKVDNVSIDLGLKF